jgi:hypothetical protein
MHSCRVQKGIQVRKVILFAVVALIVIGVGTWLGIRAQGPTGAVAAGDQPPAMMTGAKGLPTSHYDDYDIVVH